MRLVQDEEDDEIDYVRTIQGTVISFAITVMIVALALKVVLWALPNV